MSNETIFCETCGESVEVKKYKIHLKFAHLPKQDKFQCEICLQEFQRKASLNYHKARHFNERKFACDLCPTSFNTSTCLYRHKKQVHKIKTPTSYSCQYCDAIYSSKSLYNAHLDSHVLECEICHKTFNKKVNYREHMRHVHPSILHRCEECGKEFKVKNNLDVHISSVHRKERNFKCSLCDKAYSEIKNLRLHEQKIHSTGGTVVYCPLCKIHVDDMDTHYDSIHSNLPKKCLFCYMRFANGRQLNKHTQRVHDDAPRKWSCWMCEKSFIVKFELTSHLKKKHKLNEFEIVTRCESLKEGFIKEEPLASNEPEEETFIGCEICGLMVNDFLYNSHKIEFHQDQYDDSFIIKVDQKVTGSDDESDEESDEVLECPVCSKIFQLKNSLQRHIKNVHKNKEANQCHVCRKEVDDVKEHYDKQHAYLLFQCFICYRRFRSRKILMKHNAFNHGKKFYCDLCDETFTLKSSLEQHIISHIKK